MRDRLTELILNAPKLEFPIGSRAQGKTYQTAQNIADHLLANGVIVLPCKVGDTVYHIIPKCSAPYNYCAYNGGYGTARCNKEPCEAYIKEISFSLSDIESIGKTIFIEKEEAERKLAEVKNGTT